MRRWLSSPVIALVALLATGCAAPPDEEVGAAREAERDLPNLGKPEPVAAARLVPDLITPFLATRGPDYLALWTDVDVHGSQIYATRFAADGAVPAKQRGILVAQETSNVQAPIILGAACAPAGDCVVTDFHLDPARRPRIGVSTLRADGSTAHVVVSRPAHLDAVNAIVAHDGARFVVVGEDAGLWSVPFVDGAQIGDPKAIVGQTPGLSSLHDLAGLACSPAGGCLVIANTGGTAGALAPPGDDFGEPFAISDETMSHLAFGGGVYLTATGPLPPFGAVRLGLDGAVLDPTPIALEVPDGTTPAVTHVEFDGTTFDCFVFNDKTDGKSQQPSLFLERIGVDGSPAPRLDLTPYVRSLAGPLTCGAGRCEVARYTDEGAVATLAVVDGVVSTNDAPLALTVGPQTPLVTLAVGARVLTIWSETTRTRYRWYDAEGDPVGPAGDLDPGEQLVGADGDGDAALLLVRDANEARAIRLVSKGKIGARQAADVPVTGDAKVARFLIPDNRLGPFRVRRFDGEGHPLADQPVGVGKKPVPLAAVKVARAGGMFLIALVESRPGIRIARALPTGELLDVALVTSRDRHIDGIDAFACNADECAVIWTEPDFVIDKFGDVAGLRAARFSPRSLYPSTGVVDPEGSAGTLTFDGRSFVVAYRAVSGIRVARLEVEGPKIAELAGSGLPGGIASVTRGRSLLFATDSGAPMGGFAPTDHVAIDAIKVRDGVEDLGGETGETSTTGAPDADAGCTVAGPASSRGAAGALFAALLVIGASLRRRRAEHRSR